MRRIQILDSHTGGEPTRLVIGGGPDLGGGPLAGRLRRLAREHDALRTGVLGEPRGSDVMVGALLCPPEDPASAAGVIFFNNAGYLGMCGHGTIGLVASLAHLGRLAPGRHRIETPVGAVQATLLADGRVAVRNVPAWRHRRAVALDVPGAGRLQGDIAWGGNWFFLASGHGQALDAARIPALRRYALAVRQALDEQGVRGADGSPVDHVELFADSPTAGVDSRSFVLCPGGEYDRSPCGTGTSAKLACLAADGALAAGAPWRQESIVGSVFEAAYEAGPPLPDGTPQIVPTITGRAHLSGEGTLLFEDDDPFAWGIPQA